MENFKVTSLIGLLTVLSCWFPTFSIGQQIVKPLGEFDFKNNQCMLVLVDNHKDETGKTNVSICSLQHILKECADSFTITLADSSNFSDCISKTPRYMFEIYQNKKVVRKVSFCFWEQISWPILESHMTSGVRIVELISDPVVLSKRIKELESDSSVLFMRKVTKSDGGLGVSFIRYK